MRICVYFSFPLPLSLSSRLQVGLPPNTAQRWDVEPPPIFKEDAARKKNLCRHVQQLREPNQEHSQVTGVTLSWLTRMSSSFAQSSALWVNSLSQFGCLLCSRWVDCSYGSCFGWVEDLIISLSLELFLQNLLPFGVLGIVERRVCEPALRQSKSSVREPWKCTTMPQSSSSSKGKSVNGLLLGGLFFPFLILAGGTFPRRCFIISVAFDFFFAALFLQPIFRLWHNALGEKNTCEKGPPKSIQIHKLTVSIFR